MIRRCKASEASDHQPTWNSYRRPAGLSVLIPTTFSFIGWFTRKHAAYLAFPICRGRAQWSVCAPPVCVLCPPPVLFPLSHRCSQCHPTKAPRDKTLFCVCRQQKAAKVQEDTMGTAWSALIEQSCRLFGMFAPSIHKWIFVRRVRKSRQIKADCSDDCAFVIAGQWLTTVLKIANSGPNEWSTSNNHFQKGSDQLSRNCVLTLITLFF